MTVQDLIDTLKQRNPTVDVVIGCEHDSAFSHPIIAIVNNHEKGEVQILPARR